MDPQQTWNDLLDAMKRKQWNEAKELADYLHEWIHNKGFPPVTVGDESLGKEWHRTIATFVCLAVANKVDDLQKRREKRKANTKPKGEN